MIEALTSQVNLPEELTQDAIDAIVEEAHTTEIPVNSASLQVRESTSRFSSAIWYNKIQEKTIMLAGLGGIGSYVGFLLSRLHPALIYLIDPDTVDTVNMSGQLYGRMDIHRNKTFALTEKMRLYSDYFSVITSEERFNENSAPQEIMICGFDNMKARKVFFEKWKSLVDSYGTDEQKANCLYIDGRLAAEEFQVFCIRGDDTYNINKYSEKYLFSDSEADNTVCSYKQTTFMANMIGSIMVNLFVNFVANQCNPLIDRDLPFYTTYNAETMFYKTES